MKEITIYQCDDGSQFELLKDAMKYEALCDKVKQIMAPMGERTHKCEIGKEYIQHDLKDIQKAHYDFLIFCADTITEYLSPLIECAEGKRDISYADYMICEAGQKILDEANFRFRCTSMKSGREYDQPYFVRHEEKWNENILRL